MNQFSSAALASAAAMFALSAFAANPPPGSSGVAVAASDKVHCYGVNSCKGSADCKTTQNECKGQNACKAQGFKGMTAKDCLAQSGVIGDLVAKK